MRTCEPQRKRIRFGLVTLWVLVSPPDVVKLETGDGTNGLRVAGALGVVGSSAQGKIGTGTWEARSLEHGVAAMRPPREYITEGVLDRESEGSIVAKKRVTTVERRDLTENKFR